MSDFFLFECAISVSFLKTFNDDCGMNCILRRIDN